MFRQFGVYTEPHVADPSWMVPVAETTPGQPMKMFENVAELLTVALEIQKRQAYESGRNNGVNEALKVLGVSFDEYITKLKASKNVG